MICSLLVACAIASSPDAAPVAASPDVAAYKEAKAKVGRDADAHVRLALWCESHGMVAERTKHLTLATLIDPSHTAARGLLGMVQYQGKWLSPEAIGEKDQADPERQAKIREYLERRAKAEDKSDDQMKLALWCEQNDLKDQATAHFHRAAQLDPGRELAWKHLGYKKEKGRWAKPEQLAAENAFFELQMKANKHWKPVLEKLRHGLASHNAAERAKAEARLTEIKDPAAVPAVWLTFAQGDARRQEVAVKLLGQIDAPGSSQALAMLSIIGRSADVTREAIAILKRRDPRDFADILIALIRKPIEYEVRRPAGINTPGELFIKGTEQNRSRRFTPLATPSLGTLFNDDILAYDAQGLPVIRRRDVFQVPRTSNYPFATINMSAVDPGQAASVLNRAGLAPKDAAKLGQSIANNLNSPISRFFWAAEHNLFNQPEYPTLDIPIGQMMIDAQHSAQAAQAQLASEVKQIEDYNQPIQDLNRKARQLLADATGVDLGDNPVKWQLWFADLQGIPAAGASSVTVKTTVEDVPVDYQPRVDPSIIDQANQIAVARLSSHGACFAAGTSVRTSEGSKPIETLLAGDRVLTQNTTSGRIGFSPVLVAYHNPPNETLKIRLADGDAPVVATGIHRFWKVGEGWAMARDLRPGDTLRAIGGVAKVSSIEPDTKQPVFNLRVAEGESFFVGETGILAHDNSLVQPSDKPFDRIGSEIAAATRK